MNPEQFAELKSNEVNRAAVHGSISSFGTYTVDEANKTFTLRYLGNAK